MLRHLASSRIIKRSTRQREVIPLFDIWTFPQSDYSLQTWVNRLSVNVEEGRNTDTMAELDLMKDSPSLIKSLPTLYQFCCQFFIEFIDSFVNSFDFKPFTGVLSDLRAALGHLTCLLLNTTMCVRITGRIKRVWAWKRRTPQARNQLCLRASFWRPEGLHMHLGDHGHRG